MGSVTSPWSKRSISSLVSGVRVWKDGVLGCKVAVHHTWMDLGEDGLVEVSSSAASSSSSSQMVHLTWRRVPGVRLSSVGMSWGSGVLRFLEGVLACGGLDDMAFKGSICLSPGEVCCWAGWENEEAKTEDEGDEKVC